jgi:hypothetical protein
MLIVTVRARGTAAGCALPSPRLAGAQERITVLLRLLKPAKNARPGAG